MLNRSIVHTILFAGALTACQTMHSAAGPKLSDWWQSAQTKAAFVLPFYRYTRRGANYYIFGKEKGGADRGTYSPFGGKANPGEGHPVVTVAREAMEELSSEQTLGLDKDQMQGHLDLKKLRGGESIATFNIIAKKSADGKHAKVLYKTWFSLDIGQYLLQKFKGNSEISNLVEVREDRLVQALCNPLKGQPIKVLATVWKNGQCQGNEMITLRPIMLQFRSHFIGIPGTLGRDKRIEFFTDLA